ncbi:MAG: hypothetical protein MK102_15295 [Fuerstiella sp.]|nr:hypothetical protein [Fuerstiella sp.]
MLKYLGRLRIYVFDDFVTSIKPAEQINASASVAAKWEQRFRLLCIRLKLSVADGTSMWHDHDQRSLLTVLEDLRDSLSPSRQNVKPLPDATDLIVAIIVAVKDESV